MWTRGVYLVTNANGGVKVAPVKVGERSRCRREVAPTRRVHCRAHTQSTVSSHLALYAHSFVRTLPSSIQIRKSCWSEFKNSPMTWPSQCICRLLCSILGNIEPALVHLSPNSQQLLSWPLRTFGCTLFVQPVCLSERLCLIVILLCCYSDETERIKAKERATCHMPGQHAV